MVIILKHTLKNIFGKPLRTLLLLFCIAVCSFSAMLCFDMSGTIRNVLSSLYGSIAGRADLMVSSTRDFAPGAFDDAGAKEIVYVETESCSMDKRNPKLYSYVTRKDITLLGLNTEAAKNMGLLPEAVKGSGYVFIGSLLSKEFQLYEGDTITLHNLDGEPVDFEVQTVLPATGILTAGYSVVLSSEGMELIRPSRTPGYSLVYLDFPEEVDVSEISKQLEEKYPYADFLDAAGDEETEQLIDSITNVFFVLFAICALMVIFITASLSQRITNERMPVVGTLRSLGVSRGITTGVLLLEHGLYGLLGSIIGVMLYSLVREPVINSMLVLDVSGGLEVTADYGQASGAVYFGVILAAVLVEIMCPLKEVLKAVNTPIRDIIFESRDTAYNFSKTGRILGIILLFIAILTAFITKSYLAQIICLASFVTAAALLFPYVLKLFSRLFEKLFCCLSMPVARMASIMMIGKKSTVGSAVLLITASSLSIVLYILADSIGEIYRAENYDCDIVVDSMTQKSSMYSFIGDLEGVSQTEYIYADYKLCKLGDLEKNVNIFGFENFSMFKGISGLPDSLKNDECYMDEFLAEQTGAKPGDVITITFESDSFLPVKRKLVLSGYCSSICYDGVGESIVISKELYQEIFKDYPAKLLVRLEGSEQGDAFDKEELIEETVETIRKYSVGSMMEVKTLKTVHEEQARESQGINTILYMLIVLGVGLCLIGCVSNQLIGFEGRRRECAVLNSVAMGRTAVTKMLFLETMFSSGITLSCAVPLSLILIRSVSFLLRSLGLSIPLGIQWVRLLGFISVLFLLFTLTSFFPARALKKMNVAMQLKYE